MEIGDIVKIINNGCTYTTYENFAKRFGYPNSASNIGAGNDKMLPNGTEGIILVKNKHIGGGRATLLILQCYDKNNTQIIISTEGVEFLRKGNANRRIIINK